MQRYCRLAAQHGMWLSLGGFQETGPDPDHLYNCHVIISAGGRIAARYRKVHLFNVKVHQGPVLMESRSTAPGNEVRTNAARSCSLAIPSLSACAMCAVRNGQCGCEGPWLVPFPFLEGLAPVARGEVRFLFPRCWRLFTRF